MSKIDELIQQYCPNGVEYRSLEDIIKLQRGKRLVKSELAETGNYAVYQNCMTPLGYHHEYNAKSDTTFIISAGAAGEIGYSHVDFWAADDVYFFLTPNEIKSKFLYYFLLTRQSEILSKVRRASIPRLSKTVIGKINFPIPQLEVQEEIVRILDKFTELTAELTARQKQYEYYRDQLLTFGDEVEWKTLGEVAEIGTGSHDTQDAIEDGRYIFYARGREPLSLNTFDFDEVAIITAGDGVGVGKVFHYAQGKYALHQRAYRIVPNKSIETRFLYFYIISYFYSYIQKTAVNSSVTSLRKPMLLKFPIPIPHLSEQARIVAILDKFDALTNSITEGLPREIELRQKQYEYYRDKLLSFPKKIEA